MPSKKKKEKELLLFIDSGAFSAMTQKAEIDIDDYIAFIKKWEHVIDVYACLDVIGDPVGSMKNQRYMEKKGLSPMPVYHLIDKDPRFFHALVDEYPYVGIGGMAGVKEINKTIAKDMLDDLFDYVCDTPDRMPKIKTHGFGMTSVEIMLRYPWYSCDSTSWVLAGRFGGVLVPHRKAGGGFVYNRAPLNITFSEQSPSKNDPGKHFDTLSDAEKKHLTEYLKSKGYSVKEMQEDYKKRDEINIIFFHDLEDSMPEWPWAFEKPHKGLLF